MIAEHPEGSPYRGNPGVLSRGFLLLAALSIMGIALVGLNASQASAAVLNVNIAGSGTGTVVSVPAGINCSNEPGSSATACTHDFGFYNGTGTLTATASEGFAFLAWSGTAGGTCVGATNPCTTGSLFIGQLTATATFAPKPSVPTVTTNGVDSVSFPSATVTGTVNPESADFPVQDCYFEYGLTTEYGEKVACRPGSIGTGTSPVDVSASIGVLEGNRTYHYRLVATNGAGTSRASDRSLTSAPAPADACPNAVIRAEQGAMAQRLPNCGAYELVTPPFTAGQGAAASPFTSDGNVAMATSTGGFAGVENLPNTGIPYLTVRTDSGWKTSAIAPPASAFPYIGTYGALERVWTQAGLRTLWFVNLKADEATQNFTPVVRDPDGSFHVAGPTQTAGDSGNLPVATAADLLSVVQATRTRPVLTDGTTDGRSASQKSLYISTRASGGQLSVRQIAYRGGATMFPTCGVNLGGTNTASGDQGQGVRAFNSISSNGNRIFFSATCSDPAAQRVWAKVGDSDPIDLSASQCPDTCGPVRPATFAGASRDGSRVYFTTEQKLLPEDQDTSGQNDLYEYDFNASGPKLRVVTGSSNPAGAQIPPFAFMRVSSDGSYVYFVATGRALSGANSRGVTPQPGANNLYVYHRAEGVPSGTTTFIGALDSSSRSPNVSPNGRHMLFHTTTDLTGERLPGDVHPDLFFYDAVEGSLSRVWTNDPEHNGAARIGGASTSEGNESTGGVPSGAMQGRSGGGASVSFPLDGSMVGFATTEPLSRDDKNRRTDAYLWEAETGRITLLSDGTSRSGSQFQASRFAGMTPSGDSMFIQSSFPLLKGHTSGQNAAYVIRRNGGFPSHAPPSGPCEGDACQGSPAAPPSSRGVGSLDPAGSGNARAGKAMSVSSSRRAALRVARLSVRVPSAGRIRVIGALVRNARRSVGKARTVNVRVALNGKAKRALAKHKRLRVKVRVVFWPKSGDAVSRTVRVAFRQPSANRKGGR